MKTVTKEGHGLGWKKQLPDPRDYRYEDFVRAPMAKALPDTVDLSSLISTVKDQGQLGSCVAHGTSSAFEAVQMKANKTATLGCRLLLYRDARILGGDFPGDNGCNIRDGVQATVKNGVAPESDWAYNISQFDSTPPAKAVSDAVKAETLKYYLMDSTAGRAQTLLNIKTCLATTGLPVVYGMPVYQQYENVGSDGIIDMPSGGSIGGHCNLFFGYKPGYLMTLNSWGQGWGAAFGGGRFSGGMGWLPEAYVQNYCSDCWTIATESQINPTPPPVTHTTFASTPEIKAYDNFVIGSDKALWYAATPTSTWISLGGTCTSAPSSVSRSAGSIDVFVRGSDSALYHKSLKAGTWSAWDGLKGIILPGTAPYAVAPDANTIEVYVVGSNSALYKKKWTSAGWGAWSQIVAYVK